MRQQAGRAIVIVAPVVAGDYLFWCHTEGS